MPRRDWYAILGVGVGADADEIKRAYRRAAFAAHPDVGEPPDPERFRDIRQAYEILGDPARRRAYDRSQQQAAERAMASSIHSRQSRSDLDDWLDLRTPFEHLFGEFPGPQGFAMPDTLRMEAILEPEEARFGCEVTLNLPRYETCPRCSGFDSRRCAGCGGSGFVEHLSRVRITIPPGVRDGEWLRFAVGGVTVEIRISLA
jgi:molecular chaperone DnaJ